MVTQMISHYRILKELGAGGMGAVFLAEDTQLDRKVAIKFLNSPLADDEQARKRFIREAQTAAVLDHPNICSIYEVGEEASHAFIVMQYVDGERLSDRISRKQIELPELLELAAELADALSEAHRHAIVHRDIKPQNIMITRRGRAKLLDFGLAKPVFQKASVDKEAETLRLMTEPGVMVGTVPYMSPEQVRGVAVDARSDIFSFGLVLYEMVSGLNPFVGGSKADIISAILTRNLPPLSRYAPDVPEELERIISKALAKDREERYQTSMDMLIDIRNLKQKLASQVASIDSMAQGSTGKESEQAPGPRTTAEGAASTRAERTIRSIDRLKGYGARGKLALAALVVSSLGLGGFAIYHLTGESKDIGSIAIMPFKNLGQEPEMEYLSDGLTESLINNLSQLGSLRVMSRSSVYRYKEQEVDYEQVRRMLKVEALVSGRVVQRGNRLMISLELVDTRDGRQIWGGQYTKEVSDLVGVQAEISREISEKLRSKLTGEEREQINRRYTVNTEAYQLYLKGRFHWNKLTEDGIRKAIEYFSEAIKKEPGYALAYAGLAESYSTLAANHQRPKDLIPLAKAYADKAVELDDKLDEAHYAQGLIKHLFEWDWLAAERELKRAMQLNPNHSSARASYSALLWETGRFQEGIEEGKRGLELDPLSLRMNINLGLAYYFSRRYEEAIAVYKKTQEIDPNFFYAHLNTGWAYAESGNYDEAIAAFNRAGATPGDRGLLLASLTYTYARSGNKAEARKGLEELNQIMKQGYVRPTFVAAAYAASGDKEQAFAWLERAYEDKSAWVLTLKVEPKFDSLRPDPRYDALLRRIGLLQ